MNFKSSSLDLGQFDAPGFKLNERIDFSGHPSGRIDPHINVDLVNPNNDILRYTEPRADFRDLVSNQLPGFNGMQGVEIPLPKTYGNSW